MKVLLLVNILMPAQCVYFNKPIIPVGGWIEGLMWGFNGSDVDLLICTPTPNVKEEVFFEQDNIGYIAVPSNDLENRFKATLERHKPDLIHIFGTEMKHSLQMLRVADTRRTMVQIQGLAFEYGQLFLSGLPAQFQLQKSKKERVAKKRGMGSAFSQQLQLEQAGKDEKEALSLSRHVLGHTSWDKTWSAQLAPQARYHSFPETLRREFYSGKWTWENCRPYSIFVSQAASPIKGFHMLMQALPGLVSDFPDTHVYVSGFYPHSGILSRFDYYNFLIDELRQNGLLDHVSFLGVLPPKEMKKQYLASNVFASCSIIENESNSVSEAKILGTPVVASYVGGVVDRIEDGIDGLFYPFNQPNMLREKIATIFRDPQFAQSLSRNAQKNARKLNDSPKAMQEVLTIYRAVLSEANHQEN